jgi:hypothetical protein
MLLEIIVRQGSGSWTERKKNGGQDRWMSRVLRDQLLAHNDWEVAGDAYASEHDRYYAAVHEYTGMLYQMFYTVGPAADARRARAFPLITREPERVPDGFVSGPEIPLGEAIKRRFFGEE